MRHADTRFEIRATDDATRTFTGYGSVFDVVDGYGDIVAPGAFRRTLKERAGRIAMLWQHDTAMPIGVWLEMREDTTGLYLRGQLADTPEGLRAYRLLKIDALSGLSIGFITKKSRVDDASGIRTLTDVELFEVSLVTLPANDEARVFDVKHRGLSPAEDLLASIDRYGLVAEAAGRDLRRSSELAALSQAVAFVERYSAACSHAQNTLQRYLAQRA